MAKYLLTKKFHTFVTANVLPTLSAERVVVGFISAIDDMLRITWEHGDVDEFLCQTYEWIAEHCWNSMHPVYKENILAAIPNIEEYMSRYTLPVEEVWKFYELYTSMNMRITDSERPELLQRAYTKLLKEEIAMKAMHPDRIEKLINNYGLNVLEMF